MNAQISAAASSPRLTAERLREPGWWPTMGSAPRKDYAGVEACGACHRDEVTAQSQSSMAMAASRAADTAILRSQSSISRNDAPFVTSIDRGRHGSTYTLARGGEAISGQILWTMGRGELGQTFILQASGDLLESQMSYFPPIARLDLTPGHTLPAAGNLQAAFGQPLSVEDARQCFACHTTAATIKGQFDPSHATPGVTCEVCHGPGAGHISAMALGQVDAGLAAILRPSQFDAVKLVDYCGACHRAPKDVAAMKDNSAINVRFQPYRLAKSRCWSKPDPRLACTACHNPHEQLVRGAGAYDAKCLACHSVKSEKLVQVEPSANKSRACPVGVSQCASCHMPKYNVPQMHGSFTDHDIRVVRSGEPFPL